MDNFFSRDIKLLVGLNKEQLLKDELGIDTYEDFIKHYPFWYEDRTTQPTVVALRPFDPAIQLHGYIRKLTQLDKGRKRLVALFEDHEGQMELTLFHNFAWIIKMVQLNVSCSVWGKPVFLPNGQKQIIYPEIIFKTKKRLKLDVDMGSTNLYACFCHWDAG